MFIASNDFFLSLFISFMYVFSFSLPPPSLFSFQSDEAEANKLRAKIIEIRQEVHKQTEEEVSKRWVFEEGVSHVLCTIQLKTCFLFNTLCELTQYTEL